MLVTRRRAPGRRSETTHEHAVGPIWTRVASRRCAGAGTSTSPNPLDLSPKRPVTVALLFATTPTSDAECAALLEIDGETIVHRLSRQLLAQGTDSVAVVASPKWSTEVEAAVADLPATVRAVGNEQLTQALDEFVNSLDDRIVIGHADVVTHDGVIAGLLRDPRVRSGILCAGQIDAKPSRVSAQQGRVSSRESPIPAVTSPTTNFLSLLVVHREDRPYLQQASGELRAKPLGTELDHGFHEAVIARGARVEHDVVALSLVALSRTPIVLRSAYRGELYWHRPSSLVESLDAQERLAAINEDKELLDSAVKPDDGFFTTFFVSPYSKYIARWAARRGLTPNQVTTFSLLLAVLAALAFAVGETAWNVVGAVLLQASFTFDCVDGQLARFSRQFSTLGAWLDSVFDRAKEGAVFVGLAFGALANDENVWHLALAALAFQAVRHYLDFSWAALQRVETPPTDPALDGTAQAPTERGLRTARGVTGLLSVGRGSRVAHWLKKIIVLPIGERLALISITAVIGGPRLVFQSLIIWGAVATLYMLTGRILRSL